MTVMTGLLIAIAACSSCNHNADTQTGDDKIQALIDSGIQGGANANRDLNRIEPDLPHSGSFKVQHAGALMSMMHKGDISAKADLRVLSSQKHLFALGAVENLQGEILVLDGEPIISYVDVDTDGLKHLKVDRSFDHRATLLVHAEVPEWSSFPIPDTIVSDEQVEGYVEQLATENGINTDQPFPFLLKGKAAEFNWHVIDWKEGDMKHSHEKHIRSGLYGTGRNMDVEILGFYSSHHHAVFTHHSTNVHMHASVSGGEWAAHVDGLSIAEGMTLHLPSLR